MRKRRRAARIFPFPLEIVLRFVPFEFECLFFVRYLSSKGRCRYHDTERMAKRRTVDFSRVSHPTVDFSRVSHPTAAQRSGNEVFTRS